MSTENMNLDQIYNFDEVFVQDGWKLQNFPYDIYASGKKHILFMAPQEFELSGMWDPQEPPLSEFNNYIRENNIQIDVVFGSYDKNFYLNYEKLPYNYNLHLWPMFWAMKSLIDCDNLSIKNINMHPQIPYIFLNANVKWHRILAMNELYCRGILNENYVSWQNRGSSCEEFFAVNDQIKISWPPKTIIQDFGQQHHSASGYSFYKTPTAFDDSFMSLVGETTTRTTFFTEKIWIPIMFKKPFLSISNCGYYKSLRQFGFELYDEIFDYSFDDEPDEHTRVKLVIDNVERIINADHNKLTKSIEEKIIKNYSLLLAHSIHLENIPNIIRQWFMYLENVNRDLTPCEYDWFTTYQSIKNGYHLKKFI